MSKSSTGYKLVGPTPFDTEYEIRKTFSDYVIPWLVNVHSEITSL